MILCLSGNIPITCGLRLGANERHNLPFYWPVAIDVMSERVACQWRFGDLSSHEEFMQQGGMRAVSAEQSADAHARVCPEYGMSGGSEIGSCAWKYRLWTRSEVERASEQSLSSGVRLCCKVRRSRQGPNPLRRAEGRPGDWLAGPRLSRIIHKSSQRMTAVSSSSKARGHVLLRAGWLSRRGWRRWCPAATPDWQPLT